MEAEHKPTDEQIAIIDAVSSSEANLSINALAGTGKTTILEMINAAIKKKPILYLAFSKRDKEVADKRLPSTTTVRTFNGLGHRVWAQTVSSITLNTKKTQEHFKLVLADLKGDDRHEASDAYWDVISGVGLAKALGYIPDGKFPHAKRLMTTEEFHASLEEKPTALVKDLIDDVLITSIKASYAGSIDFNDQVYMPALFGGTFPRFPNILVDEKQDLNPTNHALLDKLVRGRICGAGDRWQSIYGFRGAVQNGMEKLVEKFSMQELDLSVSFRCPRAVVEAARWRVPHFKWIKDGGIVGELRNPTFEGIQDGAAILCRNNAPLFKMAFGLLSHKRSVQVAGSEIGPKLIALLEKLAPDDTPQRVLLILIDEWLEDKLETTQTPSKVKDMAECMKVFATFGRTLSEAVGYAKHIFEQKGTIKLLTGHKAKGGEWDTVYHLDPFLISETEQDLNLRYVITTRAASTLYEINSRDFKW